MAYPCASRATGDCSSHYQAWTRIKYTEEDLADMTESDFEKLLKMWAGLKQEGVSTTYMKFLMTIAHTNDDVAKTLERADKVMATL
jgi:glutamate-1-semialdehyde aminotransferase